jgi:serine/threonine-protein kinase
MSYCINPSCPQPKNPTNVSICRACGSKLLLRDRYQILGILGKGGFGATFVAIDRAEKSKLPCVVKQLRPASQDPGVFKMAKELFEREAQTLYKVGDHPQVPKLLHYFEDCQQFYLVQEYIKGRNLHQEVKRRGPFSEAEVRQFLSELLPVLQYIHAQRMIHRDIKPANLIHRETDPKLVLIDFGAVKNQVNTIAATHASSHTAFTAFAVGTAGFAPPEQMAMRPVYASDIYAVGVTSIYLLTGKSPKDLGCDPLTGEMRWERYVTVSEPFAEVLRNMLEVSVRHRYKSADEALQALDLISHTASLEQNLTAIVPVDRAASHSPRSQSFTRVNSSLSTSATTRMASRQTSFPISDSANSQNLSDLMNYSMVHHQTHLADNSRRNPEPSRIYKKAGSKLDAQAIRVAYMQGNRNFAQQDLRYLNLQKVNLSGCIFYQSQLMKTNFQGSDLSNADLGRVNLNQAILRSANLSRAYLGYADLEGADLRGADLSFAHLKYANLQGANLCGANLTNAQVAEKQLELAKTNWMTVMPSGKRGFW